MFHNFNPKNRYINLTGMEQIIIMGFLSKSLTIGGQKEELYDEEDLDSIGYAFRRAGNPEKKNVNLHLSKKILEKIKRKRNNRSNKYATHTAIIFRGIKSRIKK